MSLKGNDEYLPGTVLLWRPQGQTWTRVVVKLDDGRWGWFGDVDLRRPAHIMQFSEVRKLESEDGMWIRAFVEDQ